MGDIKDGQTKSNPQNLAVLDEFLELDSEDPPTIPDETQNMELARISMDIDPVLRSTLEFDDYPDYYPNQGFKRYRPTLKAVLPSKVKESEKDVLPIDRVGCFSFITYLWMSNLLWAIYRKGGKAIINYRIPILDSSRLTTQRFTYLWQEEIKIKGIEKASLASVTSKFVRTRWIMSTILFSIALVSGIITPVYILEKLLEFLESPDEPLLNGVLYIVYIIVIDSFRTILISLCWILNIRTGLRLRSAILGILFNKIVQLKCLGDKSAGELINLFANDGTRIFEYILWGQLWIAGTMTVIMSLVYTFWLLGLPALTAIGVFVLFYCLQLVLSKLIAHYRFLAIKASDKRVRQMSEVLNYIKMIKLYAWESSFLTKITKLRNEERGYLEKMSIIHNIGHPLSLSVPIIAAIVTFLTCYAAGYTLTSTQVFPVVGTLIMSRFGLLLLPLSVGKIAEFKTSITRAEAILRMEEFQPITAAPSNPDFAIQISNGFFAWDSVRASQESPVKVKKCPKRRGFIIRKNRNDGNNTKVDGKCEENVILNENQIDVLTPVLYGVNLAITHNRLIGICGSVGSGKSSLISAILGQLNIIRGDVSVRGLCSYVSQQAWIMNATVYENITFGEPLDEKRFNETTQCCGLTEDIQILPAGLETEIGERGVNLSGGQKQRISLARAVYSNRDIYLLDDPLSAVDYRVGSHIFKHCIKGVLKNKTVIFVSHLTHYLDQCDYIYVLKDGKISDEGDPKQLKLENGVYTDLVTALETMQDDAENNSKPNEESVQNGKLIEKSKEMAKTASPNEKETEAGKRITVNERMESGGISFNTYTQYFRAAGGYIVAFFIVLTIGLNIGVVAFSNWWLSTIIDETSDYHNVGVNFTNNTVNNSSNSTDQETSEQSRSDIVNWSDMDMLIYGCLLLAIFVSILFRSVVYVKATLRASSQLHKNVLIKVIESPMRFFETVPIGRILNIFSKDQDEVDTQLSIVMESFLNFIWMALISVLMVVLVYPWFLIPLTAFTAIFCLYSMVFQSSLREMKRFENVSRSPLFGHISAMIQGLPIIHSFQKEKDFIKKYCKLQDENTVLQMQLQLSTRWLAFRLDLLVVLLTVTNSLFIVFWKGIVPAAFAGLAMSYSNQLSGLLHFLIRNMAETQARFTNVERIVHYTQTLVREGSEIVSTVTPSKNWPSNGNIVFQNVSMRYREGLPLALNDVSFKVGAGERIGIIGRTGSGKSSLAVVLFRLVELANGNISIDDVDISQIPLLNLRQKLSLIPQDPVLFLGTIRYNLDTFQQYTDDEVWESLERTGLKSKISSLPNQLYAPVVENGENFSVGERQLLCLARALLRNSQIILLDEATASVDATTDFLVQKILEEAFSHCTIMTIAHRIHTVLNYDRILILSYGQVLEYDNPAVLRSNSNSVLSMMLQESKEKN